MAIDNTKLAYSSEWNIDEILDYQDSSTNVDLSEALGPGGASLITINHQQSGVPRTAVQYKPSTQNAWFEPGDNLQNSSSNLVAMETWVDASTINFYLTNGHGSGVNVEIRYWVLSDD